MGKKVLGWLLFGVVLGGDIALTLYAGQDSAMSMQAYNFVFLAINRIFKLFHLRLFLGFGCYAQKLGIPKRATRLDCDDAWFSVVNVVVLVFKYSHGDGRKYILVHTFLFCLWKN